MLTADEILRALKARCGLQADVIATLKSQLESLQETLASRTVPFGDDFDMRSVRAARETLKNRKPADLTESECMVLVALIDEVASPLEIPYDPIGAIP